MEMTLAEAIVVADKISRLGYPTPIDRELLIICGTKISEARIDVRLRYLSERNTPSEGPSKTKLPEAPASGGGPIPQPL